MSENEFILRFYGDGITPESFTIKELSTILEKIDSSYKKLIESKFPEIDLKKEIAEISLISIENKSESLKFKTLGHEQSSKAFVYWSKQMNDKKYQDLPDSVTIGYKPIFDVIKKKNCSLEITHKSEKVCVLEPNSRFEKPKSNYITKNCNIAGELIKIGGDNSRAWIKGFDNEIISFKVSRELARSLSPKLYNILSFRGNVKENILTNKIIEFKLYEVLEYEQGKTKDAIEKIKNISIGYWDKLNSDDEIKKELRDDD